MALRNAFENLGLDSTLQSIRDRLPSALGGTGGVKVDVGSSALPTGAATDTSITQQQGTSGSAVPSKSIQVAGSDGTNLRTVKTLTDGRLVVSDSSSPFASAITSGGSIDATTTGATIAANSNRSLIEITNSSDTDIWLSLTTSASTSSGIFLRAWGGTWSQYYSGAVTAIHNNTTAGSATTGTTKRLTYVEY